MQLFSVYTLYMCNTLAIEDYNNYNSIAKVPLKHQSVLRVCSVVVELV